jgi:hypothetical protein
MGVFERWRYHVSVNKPDNLIVQDVKDGRTCLCSLVSTVVAGKPPRTLCVCINEAST